MKINYSLHLGVSAFAKIITFQGGEIDIIDSIGNTIVEKNSLASDVSVTSLGNDGILIDFGTDNTMCACSMQIIVMSA